MKQPIQRVFAFILITLSSQGLLYSGYPENDDLEERDSTTRALRLASRIRTNRKGGDEV
jgi:hypothetical protein